MGNFPLQTSGHADVVSADGKCDNTRLNDRRRCQKCRYERCLEVGMSPKWVLNNEQKSWFITFYRQLAQLGLSGSSENSLKRGLKNEPQPMPDLLPPMEADR